MTCLKCCTCIRHASSALAMALRNRDLSVEAKLIHLASRVTIHTTGGAPLSGMWS